LAFPKITVAILCVVLLGLTEVAFAQNPTPPPHPDPNQVSDSLNSVFLLSISSYPRTGNLTGLDAWAIGQSGVIIHWNGTKWSEINSPTTDNLQCLFMVNSTSGWAVGGGLTKGTILNYDGKNWTEWTKVFNPSTNNSSITAPLNSVGFDANGSTGWIVGGAGNIFSWNGTGWVGMPQENVTLRAVSIAASNNAWVVGDKGTILNWHGSAWSKVTSPTNATLRSVSVNNATSGWAVGGDGNAGTILSLNNAGWSNWSKISFTANSSADMINATLNSISMATPNLGWTVGASGWMLNWNGSMWLGQTGATSQVLNAVSMAQNVTSAAWAVGGGGTILGWDGMHWAGQFASSLPGTPTSTLPPASTPQGPTPTPSVPEYPMAMVGTCLAIILVTSFIAKIKLPRKP
jgi:hypothetical protein